MIQGFCYPLLLVPHSWKVHLNDFTWHSLLAKNEGGPQLHNLRQRGNNLWQRRHYQLFNFSATLQLYTSSRNHMNQTFDISTKVMSDVRYKSPVFWCPQCALLTWDSVWRLGGGEGGAEEGGWPGWVRAVNWVRMGWQHWEQSREICYFASRDEWFLFNPIRLLAEDTE